VTSPDVVRGLLDTSVVIALESLTGDALPEEPAISAITLAELAAGPHATDDDDERARRQDRLQRVEALLDPLPFDAAAARAYARVYAATRSADGRPRGARAGDLMIAAIALANGLPLFTRNTADFEHLATVGLDVQGV
jgi:predicted nucleic acid-binding protein